MVRLCDDRDIDSLARVLDCKAVKLPIKYLGLQLGATYKERGMLDLVMARFEKR